MAPARADVDNVLETSYERWGEAAAGRYEDLIIAAIDRIAEDPALPWARPVGGGVASYHIKHARRGSGVRFPVHVIFFRVVGDAIEILRVLHESMDSTLHPFPAISKRR